jgi:hypothetical protein
VTNEPPSLNGDRFLVPTLIDRGVALVGHFQNSTKTYVRQSPVVDVHPGGGGATEFIQNRALIRCEERLGAVAVNPS